MPSGLIEKNERVSARRDRTRDILKMEDHGLGGAGRQDEPGAFAFGGAVFDKLRRHRKYRPTPFLNRAAPRAWSRALPIGAQTCFLPGPGGMSQRLQSAKRFGMANGGLVLNPNLNQFVARLLGRNFVHAGGEFLSNAGTVSSSCA